MTTGEDFASARLKLKELGRAIGYRPEPGKAGTIQDHFSTARLDLILETNVRMAQGYGCFAQGNTEVALELYPCWELFRAEDRVMPRDWHSRWLEAAHQVGDEDAARCLSHHGRMIARRILRSGRRCPRSASPTRRSISTAGWMSRTWTATSPWSLESSRTWT